MTFKANKILEPRGRLGELQAHIKLRSSYSVHDRKSMTYFSIVPGSAGCNRGHRMLRPRTIVGSLQVLLRRTQNVLAMFHVLWAPWKELVTGF
jgi:hypothetical protein